MIAGAVRALLLTAVLAAGLVRYRADLLPVSEEFFGNKGPASTLVEVPALAHPDWLIEYGAFALEPG